MKEVKSQSKWVGKILTCSKCNRSYEVEAGDIIHNIGIGRYPVYAFKLLCGCWWNIIPEE